MKNRLIFFIALLMLFATFSCSCGTANDGGGNGGVGGSDGQSGSGTPEDTNQDAAEPCEHIFGEWQTIKPSTCKEEGMESRVCAECDEAEERTTPKSEIHTPVTDAAIEPTCKSEGLSEGSHCSVCDKVLTAQTALPKSEEHSPVTDAAIEPTCKSEGLSEGSHCSVCDKVLTAQTVLPKSDEHTPVTDAAVAPTCKSEGLSEGSHCSVCDKVLIAQTALPKSDEHSPSDWITDTEASCKLEGERHKECTVCETVIEKETLPRSQAHGALKSVAEMPKGVFCGDAGQCRITEICSVCGEQISSADRPIPEKHSVENGSCQACGLPESTTKGIYFGLNPDKKSYFAVPAKDFTGGRVVIGVYNGLSVTEVDFVGCDSLNSIVLADCVERIGSFEACFKLSTVKIGNRVTEIPEYAFRDCGSLSDVTVGDGVVKIGENAFSGCAKLWRVYISGSHDWTSGGNRFYGDTIGKEYGMESAFATKLKNNPWEWNRI